MSTEATFEMRVMAEAVSLRATADTERMVALFADDASFQDMPFEHVHRGKAAIRQYLDTAFAKFAIAQVINRVSQDGPWVLTERTDFVTFRGETVEIPVMGCVEVIDGKIRQTH